MRCSKVVGRWLAVLAVLASFGVAGAVFVGGYLGWTALWARGGVPDELVADFEPARALIDPGAELVSQRRSRFYGHVGYRAVYRVQAVDEEAIEARYGAAARTGGGFWPELSTDELRAGGFGGLLDADLEERWLVSKSVARANGWSKTAFDVHHTTGGEIYLLLRLERHTGR